jgi:hypothetical protein
VTSVIERLPFRLPDFTRVTWVSEHARQVWQPRVTRIREAWLDVERRSVQAGVRRCAMQHADVSDVPRFAEAAATSGLTTLPLTLEGAPASRYRVAVGLPPDVLACAAAWRDSDDAAMGALLGYPACCIAFFRRTWVDARATDTTWAMATGCDSTIGSAVDVDGPPESNILWRWLGVRAIPHLPCSTRCVETSRLANAMLGVARSAGFTQEVAWLLDMLSWPVEWSALHGIAEVKTPVLKVAIRTDATTRRRVVRRRGTAYPAEGGRGTTFPYRRDVRANRIASPVRPTTRHAAVTTAARWTDNGFATEDAMRAAHAPIVELTSHLLTSRRPMVLDLGCGNGALLQAIAARTPHASVVGVERNGAKVEHARQILEGVSHALFTGDIFDDAGAWRSVRPDLILLMPGRLLEVPGDRAARLRHWLHAQRGAIVAYAYGDWLSDQQSLAQLCTRAGLETAAGIGACAAPAAVKVESGGG